MEALNGKSYSAFNRTKVELKRILLLLLFRLWLSFNRTKVELKLAKEAFTKALENF